MDRIMNISVISNIMKDLVPYSEEHACLNIFIILYRKIMEEGDEYYEYYTKEDDEHTKEERDLLSFFIDRFHRICVQLTSENTAETLDEFRELRDDCHEQYEILKKGGGVRIRPFRIIASGEVIGFESSRKPCTKKFEYEGFISCEL
jgi:hypothetical protein